MGFLILQSCNFFGPVDSSIQTKNVDFNEKDIIGRWKLDKFSYEYLSKKDNIDSIYLALNADNSFKINNSSSLFKQVTKINGKDKINGKIDNIKTIGKWEIKPYSSYKVLVLTYENCTHQSGINFYKKENEFQIWYFFGDPDSGERLRFVKEK